MLQNYLIIFQKLLLCKLTLYYQKALIILRTPLEDSSNKCAIVNPNYNIQKYKKLDCFL